MKVKGRKHRSPLELSQNSLPSYSTYDPPNPVLSKAPLHVSLGQSFVSVSGPLHLLVLPLRISSPLIFLPILHVAKVTALERPLLATFSRGAPLLSHPPSGCSILFLSEHLSQSISFLYY